MTILVTGGAGFIGSNFILDWFEQGPEPVLNIDKLTYAGNLQNLATVSARKQYFFFRIGIEETNKIRRLLGAHNVRAIINFAAESHVDRSIAGPEAFFQTNVIGTLKLLEAAREYWTSGEAPKDFRFLQVSTDEVYGSLQPDEPGFRETDAFEPNSPYAASKAGSDHIVRAYGETYGLPVLITHCSNNYGPFQFPEKLIPLVILNALGGKPLPLYGDGQQVRDWLYVSDHCDALNRVLSDGQPGETYNIGGNSERNNLTVVHTICVILDELRPLASGKSYAEQIAFVRDRPGHDRRYAIDASKLARTLQWSPRTSFEGGIRRTVEWYLANPAWTTSVTSGEYREWVARQYA
ncbi:dTDP-glucose 4,6-dehydratase [Youhaiella tibetensis]|uniref:dTDP-glucose 4,6-dehydratase n=1 Tax=Paradevosia tibetensis TaxID=1447062 RepID=A0A5B9DIY7_9HYPH|nr:dTDP-glucose 4,6-dehydratase [Youhaiella tibetensis]QEE19037.1 dTDP-glucose 4,6-dehydratase [Youhaiella tibetensis]GGF36871.1 dTDP-glucose 4,6-dehydratase [Youhaiella tibetensis]